SPSSASYRAYRPGIAVRASMAHVTSRVFPTRKTKSRHPPNCGRALFRSDGRVAVKHRGRSLSKSDRCCQRQRLSFIRRGVVPNRLSRKRNALKGLIGRPFRASKAHRLPKSVGYVSARPRQVKQKWLKNRAFGPFRPRIPRAGNGYCDVTPVSLMTLRYLALSRCTNSRNSATDMEVTTAPAASRRAFTSG